MARSALLVSELLPVSEKFLPRNFRRSGGKSNSVSLRWKPPEVFEQAIRGYSVEIQQYSRREFTENARIVVENLAPNTRIQAQVRSCVQMNLSICGPPAFFDARTDVTGESPEAKFLHAERSQVRVASLLPPSSPIGAHGVDLDGYQRNECFGEMVRAGDTERTDRRICDIGDRWLRTGYI